MTDIASTDAPSRAKHKFACLILMAAYFTAFGIISNFVVDGSSGEKALRVVTNLTVGLSALTWCRFDARERKSAIGSLMAGTIVLICIVGVPVYLLRTRGVRGVLSIIIAAAIFAGLLGLSVVAGQATAWLREIAR